MLKSIDCLNNFPNGIQKIIIKIFISQAKKCLHKSRSWKGSSVVSLVPFFGHGGIWNSIISEDAFGSILVDDWCTKNTHWSLGNSILNNIPEAFMLLADNCNLWENLLLFRKKNDNVNVEKNIYLVILFLYMF